MGVMGKYRIGDYFNKIFKSPYNPDEYIQIYIVAGIYYVAAVWVPLRTDIIDTPYQAITTITTIMCIPMKLGSDSGRNLPPIWY